MDHVTSFENKDFENFITIQIYLNGFLFFENEEEKYFKMNIPLREFESVQEEKIEIFKPLIEEKIKKYMISKIKEKCTNVVSMSRKLNIPVKHILHCYFINNRIDNIEIIWSGAAMKEFRYVPNHHYLEYKDDFIFLKIKGFKFKRKM